MKTILAIVGAIFFTMVGVQAQVARPMWRTELPGGNYSVALTTIASVSTHEYVLDRVVKVYELSIDTTGSVEARFYYLEPVKPTAPYGQSVFDKAQEKLQDGAQRVSGETNDPLLTSVTKMYPNTTHAHTVEYRLQTRDDVQKMFKSVETAWRTNQDTSYKP